MFNIVGCRLFENVFKSYGTNEIMSGSLGLIIGPICIRLSITVIRSDCELVLC